ncbi:helix-turn-helix transcriptional regulator [Bradyrhizobium sp. 200]|uniref:winged helix-turn-helix transcriptional regulator n=1 Tax=Bradyrhizobium sp. 200 TaxID=2782665 RepID=UPI0020005133|nr:helix-turn-helix domain-containing protein [Bradyrhizobium sp. 200]UPJ49205.1 helix-turn-helix transcriptional regulator [Bradyrhizobium sp. 200]
MKKQTNGNEAHECASERARAQFQRALRVLSGKWKGEILWQLVDGKQRFGQLRRAIPDVTQHMLTTQLRDLESEGLVKRTVFPEVPPRVEYEMTPAARALRPVFDELFRWANAHARPEPGADAAGKGDDKLP